MAAPSAGQVAGDEAKNQLADVITNKQPTHDADEATQANDKAAPDASGDKSTSVSDEVDTAETQETTSADADTPSKALPELELGEDPTPRPPSTDSSVPPPLPEKDTTVTNKHTPTSEETFASPSQTAEPAPTNVEDKTEEPSAQPTEPEAPETETADSSKQDADEEGPKPQSGVDGDNRAVEEGSTTHGDGKANDTSKLTLRTDRVRELSTASIMSASSSTPGTPAEEVASSAVEESGAPGQAGTMSKSKRKREKEKEKKREKEEKAKERKKDKDKDKGEKNSPHPQSRKTVHNADDSTIQDRNLPVVAATPPVDIPTGDSDGELVEKVASSEEDAPVMVNKVDGSGEDSTVKVEMPQDEAEKTADGDTDAWSWA